MILWILLLKIILTILGIVVAMWFINKLNCFSSRVSALQVQNKKRLGEFKLVFLKTRETLSSVNTSISGFKKKLTEKLLELLIGGVGLFFIFGKKRKK